MMSSDEASGSAGRRNSIQSVGIAMGILESLAGSRGAASLSAIAAANALPPPQAHRYLQSLIAAGMARQDDATGRYDLGEAALRLGLAALARTDAFALTDRAMQNYVQDSGHTIILSALGPAGPTVLRIYPGRPPVVMALQPGSLLPLLFSATGQAFLAFGDAAEIDHLLAQDRAKGGMTAPAAAAVRARVQAAGSAQERGKLIPGLTADAFPVFDVQGRAPLVVTAVTTADRGYGATDPDLATLRDACRAVSSTLGWRDTKG